MAQVTREDNKAGCTIEGVTVEPIPDTTLSEQAYVMLAVEHYKKAIQYDILASQAREPRTDSGQDAALFRYCGVQPDDDWVKRVERLNAIIDGMNGRGHMCECGKAIVGTVVV